MSPIWIALFNNILVPELMRWLRSRQEQGLPLPTDAEVIAKLHTLADQVIAEGNAFLASKGAQ